MEETVNANADTANANATAPTQPTATPAPRITKEGLKQAFKNVAWGRVVVVLALCVASGVLGYNLAPRRAWWQIW